MIIQIIVSLIDLITKTIDLYDSQYCSKDNKDCSLKYPLIVGNFVQMKKPFYFAHGFKSHCTSINECFSKLEGCLNSRPNIKRKIFPIFGNEFLPPSKTISLTGFPVISTLKQKDICDYNPICIMLGGLMFDYAIMNIISNNKLERHNK